MRTRCKILIFLLLLTLITGNTSVFAENVATGDVFGEKVEARLLNFGIVKNPTVLQNSVTMAEYTAMLIRALGLDNTVEEAEGDSWAKGYMQRAESIGLHDYCSSSLETATVTLKDALIMASVALGYGVTAAQNDEAQYATALKLNLTDDVKIENTDSLCRRDVYGIIYNMLDCDICSGSAYSQEKVTYEIEKGHTLLDDLYNLKDRRYFEGIVEATAVTGILGNDECERGEVIIGGKRFKSGNSGAENYIGEYVCFYADCENEDSVGEISYITTHKDNNRITVNSRDIENADLQTITYTDDSRRKKLTLENTTYIFNNKCVNSPVDFSKGSFTFIDNDGDNKYEVVLAYSIFSSVIEDSSGDGLFTFTPESVFNGKYGVELDQSDEDVFLWVYDANGEEAEVASIIAGDAVSFTISNDGKYISAHICPKGFSGQVTALDESESIIEIDGHSYYYTPQFKRPSTGDNGMFYTDINGEIFYMAENYSDYVYVYKAGASSGISKNPEIKVFDGDEFLMYTLSSKPKIDGTSYTDSALCMAAIKTGTVAAITVNKSGEVTKLDFGDEYASQGERIYCENDNGFCDYNNKELVPFSCNSLTKLFFVPQSGEEEDFFNTFPLSDDTEYVTAGYDFDTNSKSVRAAVVVMDCDDAISAGFNAASVIMAVNEIKAIKDENEDYSYQLSGISSREEKSYTAAQKQNVFNVLSDVEKGDVIQFVLNWENEIALVRKVMDKSQLKEYYYSDNDYKNVELYSTAEKINKGVMTNLRKYKVNEIISSCNGESITSTVPSSLIAVSGTTNKGFENYFIYDSEKKEFRNGSISTITTAEYGTASPSPVYIRSRNGVVQFIVEFK